MRQSPTHGDIEPKKPLIAKKPQVVPSSAAENSNELRPAIKPHKETNVKVKSIPVSDLAERDYQYGQRHDRNPSRSSYN